MGVCEGKICGIPYCADHILVCDPVACRVSGIDTTSVATGSSKWCAVVACEGKVYGIPLCADHILVCDTVLLADVPSSNLAQHQQTHNVSQCSGSIKRRRFGTLRPS